MEGTGEEIGEGQQADDLAGEFHSTSLSHWENTGCEAAAGGAVSWPAVVLRRYLPVRQS